MTHEVSFDNEFDLNLILCDKKNTPEEMAILNTLNHYLVIELNPNASDRSDNNELQTHPFENNLFEMTFKKPIDISNSQGVSSFECFIHFTGINEVVKPRQIIFMPGMIDHLKPLNHALVHKLTNGNLIIIRLNDRDFLDSHVIGKLKIEKDIFDTNIRNNLENNSPLPLDYEIKMSQRVLSEAEWNAIKFNQFESFWCGLFFIHTFALIWVLVSGYEGWNLFNTLGLIVLGLLALPVWLTQTKLFKYHPFPIIKTHQTLYLLYDHLNAFIGLIGRYEETFKVPEHWQDRLINSLKKNGSHRHYIEYETQNKMIVKFGDEFNLEQEGAKKFIKLWRYHLFMLVACVITCFFLWIKTPIFYNAYLQYERHYNKVEAINLIDWKNNNLKNNTDISSDLAVQIEKLKNQIIFFDGLISCKIESKEAFAIKNICVYKQLVIPEDKNNNTLLSYVQFNNYLANYKLPLTSTDFLFEFSNRIGKSKDPEQQPLFQDKYPIYSDSIIEKIKSLKNHKHIIQITYLLQNRKLIDYVDTICASVPEDACNSIKTLFLKELLFNYQMDAYTWDNLRDKVLIDNQLPGAELTLFNGTPDVFFTEFANIQTGIFNNYLSKITEDNKLKFWIESNEGQKFKLHDISLANDNNKLLKPETLTGHFKIIDLRIEGNNIYLDMKHVDYDLRTSQIIAMICIILLLSFLIINHLIKFLLCLRFPKIAYKIQDNDYQNRQRTNEAIETNAQAAKPKRTENSSLDLQGKKRN